MAWHAATNIAGRPPRSVHLDHLDPLAATRDAHIAANHAFSRARERSSASSDDTTFPVLTKPFETTINPQPCQSVRFVSPNSLSGPAPTVGLPDPSTDMFLPLLRPESRNHARSAAAVAAASDAQASVNSGAEPTSILGLQPPSRPYRDPPPKIVNQNGAAEVGIAGVKLLVEPKSYFDDDDDGNGDDEDYDKYDHKNLLTTFTRGTSLIRGLRRTKSLLVPSSDRSATKRPISFVSPSGKGHATNDTRLGPTKATPDESCNKRNHSSLPPLRSVSMVQSDSQRKPDYPSQGETMRDLALKLAQDKWTRGDVGTSCNERGWSQLHHLPTLLFKSPSKDVQRLSAGHDQQSAAANDSSPHADPSLLDPSSLERQDGSLRLKARRASCNLRNKLRGLFKPSSEDAAEAKTFPDQHVECKKTHVRESQLFRDASNSVVSKCQLKPDGPASRVGSGSHVSMMDVPDDSAPRSRKDSSDGVHTGQNQSRSTSWTGSGDTETTSHTWSTWADWDSTRHSGLIEAGSRPPSCIVAPSGPIVDSQRVYSALMKRVDDSHSLKPIQEQAGLESPASTIKVSMTGDDNNSGESPALDRPGNSTRARFSGDPSAALPRDHGEGNTEAGTNDVFLGSGLEHPVRSSSAGEQWFTTDRHSAFVGSPASHLFRTRSPYRKALQQSMVHEMHAAHPDGLRLSIAAEEDGQSCATRQREEAADADTEYDSPSVYSTDSPLRPTEEGESDQPVQQDTETATTESAKPAVPTRLRPFTHNPSGRLISNANSIEWKAWLSSHVAKHELESPSRKGPGVLPHVPASPYSPVTMPPSPEVQHTRQQREPARPVSDYTHEELSRAQPPNQPRALNTSRQEGSRAHSKSGEGSQYFRLPKLRVSSPPPLFTPHDENTPPTPRTLPPIPTKNPLRKAMSVSTIHRRRPRPAQTTIAEVLAPFHEGQNRAASTEPDSSVYSLHSYGGYETKVCSSSNIRVAARELDNSRGDVKDKYRSRQLTAPPIPPRLDGGVVETPLGEKRRRIPSTEHAFI